jgi:hypothetical protein
MQFLEESIMQELERQQQDLVRHQLFDCCAAAAQPPTTTATNEVDATT